MLSTFFEDLDTVLEKDPAARSRFEVATCYPGLHAVWFHRLTHGLWQSNWGPLRWLARFIGLFARWLTGIEIHPGARLGRRVFIDHGLGVVIGETAEVGDDCTIYQGVTLGGTALERGAKRHPTLEAGVVIGAGAKVLGPFTVGEGAKVGSNAVVVKAVPKGATVVGIPARLASDEPGKSPAMGDHESFAAYGLSSGVQDPLDILMHQMMDELKSQRAVIEELQGQLTRSKPAEAPETRKPE
ncbi:MAG: serine O-acetyltransferase [Burkholderiaceae bacterium]|jgi:serine O-acetyltransferase